MLRTTKMTIATALFLATTGAAQANPVSLQQLATEFLANATSETFNEIKTSVSQSVLESASSLMAESAATQVEEAQQDKEAEAEKDNATND